MVSHLLSAFLMLALLSIPSLTQPILPHPTIPNPNTITPPSTPLLRSWPKAPWSLPSHQDGHIEIEFYGRHLPYTIETELLIYQSVSDIDLLLHQSFDPARQVYLAGVAEFNLRLEARSPATKEEVLEMFWWMRMLVGRYRDSPTEVKGGVLFVGGEVRCFFGLMFPGIKS